MYFTEGRTFMLRFVQSIEIEIGERGNKRQATIPQPYDQHQVPLPAATTQTTQINSSVVRPSNSSEWGFAIAVVGISLFVAIPPLHRVVESAIAPFQIKLVQEQQGKGNQENPTFDPVQEESIKTGDRVNGIKVSSGYGYRKRPCTGCSTYHAAVDLALPENFTLVAPEDGYAWEVNHGGVAGLGCYFTNNNSFKFVIIQNLHANDCTTGEIKAGELWSLVGSAGTGPHAHIAVFAKKQTQPPVPSAKGTKRYIPSEKLLTKLTGK